MDIEDSTATMFSQSILTGDWRVVSGVANGLLCFRTDTTVSVQINAW